MGDNILMENWPNRRLLDLLKLDIPIIQAPMAGSDSVPLARSVSSTGALGSLACALLTPDGVREAARAIREGMSRPFNLNFFCHTMELPDIAAKERWKNLLRSHYERLGTLYVVAERWILGWRLRYMHAKNHFSDTLSVCPRNSEDGAQGRLSKICE